MATLRLLFAATLFALPLWVASTAPAHACSCGTTTSEAVGGADLIVLGTVTGARVVGDPSVADGTLSDGSVEWTLNVDEYVKGSGSATLVGTSTTSVTLGPNGEVTFYPGTSPSCGWAPQEGRYLLFLYRDDAGHIETGACAGNTLITADTETFAADYIAEVRAEVAAQQMQLPPTGSGPPHHGAPIVPLVAASALAVVGLTANAAYALRQRG